MLTCSNRDELERDSEELYADYFTTQAPVPESFKRAQQQASLNESFGLSRSQGPHDNDPETTFL